MTPHVDGAAPLLWEQHCCLPLSHEADVSELARYMRPAGSYVSVNVGYAPHSTTDVFRTLQSFRAGVETDERLFLATTTDDLDRAGHQGTVAVAFDLEDSGPLDGRLDLVGEFYDLGVRSLAPTYNRANRAGGGCLDEHDTGLTRYGRDLVAEMNAVGMLVDASHCGTRTAMDLCRTSTHPVIYSHSCMRSLWDHPRNITDEQARACAATGGVVGITGVRHFLGPDDDILDMMLRHIDHAVELVGPEHIGLSTDFVFDYDDLVHDLSGNPDLFHPTGIDRTPDSYLPPEGLLSAEDALRDHGYSATDTAAVLGGNFRRVAERVWQR